MAILGIGIDQTDLARISKLLESDPDAFLKRIAHPKELLIAKKHTTKNRSIEFWAGRFAAKEAFSKALGTGIGKTVSFLDIAIVQKKSGQPFFVFSKNLALLLKKKHIFEAHISITHTNQTATAFVILETRLNSKGTKS